MPPSALALLSPARTRGLVADLRGGLTAAFVGIPAELIYGLIAVAPLGAAAQVQGVVACFFACIVAAVACSAAGGHPGQIPGSRAALALVVAALIGDLLRRWPGWFGGAPGTAEVLAVVFATVVLAGLLQIAFGLLGIGQLVKYLPAPVLSGITNGVAILIVAQIVNPLFGVPAGTSLQDPLGWIAQVRPLNLIPGLIAAILFVRPIRRLGGLPPIVVALTAAVLAYYLLLAAGAGRLGPTFGAIPSSLPAFTGIEIAAGRHAAHWPEVFRLILPYALTLAALASIESLLSAAAVDAVCQTRHDSNRELIAQGVGNIGAGLFGGLPVAATIPRTLVNIHAGARSNRSNLVYAAILAIAILGTPGLLGAVPQVATAGILLGVAWQMVDPWSRRTLRRMLLERPAQPDPTWRSIAANGLVMLGVAFATLILGLVWALTFGILLTTLFFLRSNQRQVIRAVASGRERRSLRIRTREQALFLSALAEDIIIIEAQGPLFFGSADRLAAEIDRRSRGADHVLVDLARVAQIDATAARVLTQTQQRLRAAGKTLHVSGITPADGERGESLAMLGDAGFVPPAWHADLDHALEAIEDEILAVRFDPEDRWRRLPLAETALGQGLDAGELARFEACLGERRFAARETIYRAGESGSSLFVVASGAVSLYLDLGNGREARLSSFSAGTVFGSLAPLGARPRANTAIADVDTTLLELDAAALERLGAADPVLAAKLHRNLSMALAERLSLTLDRVRGLLRD